jgi:hypothetical protein
MLKHNLLVLLLFICACSAERRAVIQKEKETEVRIQDSIEQKRTADSTQNIQRIRSSENATLRKPNERDLKNPGDKVIPIPRR